MQVKPATEGLRENELRHILSQPADPGWILKVRAYGTRIQHRYAMYEYWQEQRWLLSPHPLIQIHSTVRRNLWRQQKQSVFPVFRNTPRVGAYIIVNCQYLDYFQQCDHTVVHPMAAPLEVHLWESSSNHCWPPGPNYTDLFNKI